MKKTFAHLAVPLLLIKDLTLVWGGENKNSCDLTVNQFSCPLCEGLNVTDCLDCEGFTNTDMVHKQCFKRKIFSKNRAKSDPSTSYQFLWNDIVGAIIWFLGAGVATACGVGGGGIYVPLGIILLKFAPKTSSGLSQCSIFGATVGGLILNIKAKHPKTDIRDTASTLPEEEYLESGGKFYTRPRIDYNMALFLAPMEMAGAVLGVMIQKVFPNWLYLFIASVILGLTSLKTFKKYRSTSIKEKELKIKEEFQRESQEVQQATEVNGHLNETDSEESDETETKSVAVIITDVERSEAIEKRRQLLEVDARQYPKEKIIALIILWIGLILITFIKGGKGVESLVGINCQSSWYYVLIASQFVWTQGFAAIYGRKLILQQEERRAVDYPFLSYDVLWDMNKLRFYGTFTFIAGIVAGLIGIGGGMVLGPLMLIMGIHPIVSSATTATMIVLTSSSVAILFITSGILSWDYASFFFITCLSGAYVGKKFIDGYVTKHGKGSLLIFILAAIIGLSTIGCIYNALSGLSANDWCFDGMKEFCDISFASKGSCFTRTALFSGST